MGRLIIYTILTILFLGEGFWIKQAMQKRAREEALYQRRVVEEQKEIEALIREINDEMKKASSPEAWEAILKDQFPKLSRVIEEKEQARIKNLLMAKLAESYMLQMEKKVARAQQFLLYSKNHPEAKRYLNEAMDMATKADGVVALLPETFDDPILTAQWLYRFALFAVERSIFAGEDATKLSDFTEVARSKLKKVLAYLPKDRNAQTALELLEQNQKALEKAGSLTGDSTQQRQIILKMLPQRPNEKIQMNDVPAGRTH
ncbi:MAG TPA: hypothetical protein VNM22_15310 [Candidatus Limnocylindrales bacterium]|nr:hypothetical protein [Candidatus Limnocylindrales bacterium]